jgi:hypothetical protein
MFASPNVTGIIKSRRMKLVVYVERMEEMIYAYKILVGKPKWRRPRRRPRSRWKDNIRIYLREMGLEVVYWINLAQDSDQWRALVNTLMYLLVPQKAETFLTSISNRDLLD